MKTVESRPVRQFTCADARDFVPLLFDGSVDAVICDPPYGVGKGVWDKWDREIATWFVGECLRILKPTGSLFMFGHNETTAGLWDIFAPLRPRWLTWFYRNSSNINHNTFGWNSQVIVFGHLGDPIFNLDEARVPYSKNTNTRRVNHDDTASNYGIRKNGRCVKRYNAGGRKPMDVIEWPSVTAGVSAAEGRWHPAQKPLGLMEMLVCVSTPPGGLVLDPFAGAATTLLAAANCGRGFVGCELSPDYHAQGMARLCHCLPGIEIFS